MQELGWLGFALEEPHKRHTGSKGRTMSAKRVFHTKEEEEKQEKEREKN